MFLGVFGVWAAQEGVVTSREVFVNGKKFVAGSHVLKGGSGVVEGTRRVIFRPRKSPPWGGPTAHFGPFWGVFGVWPPHKGGVTPREVFVNGKKFVAGWHGLRGGSGVVEGTRRVIFRPRKFPRGGGPRGHFGPF